MTPLPPLLPLPEPAGATVTRTCVIAFTADQMQAYATAYGEAVAAALAPKWLPIEEAPKGSGEDGPDSTQHPDYVDPPRLLLNTAEGVIVGYYDWYYHPGYGHGAEPGVSAWRDNSGGQAYKPTHFMHLPPTPPKGETP